MPAYPALLIRRINAFYFMAEKIYLLFHTRISQQITNVLNKKKIINDPVYGFISIPREIIFDLIEHPYFQRLRRIRQLGMTYLVYPGALHTRFHHAIGALHLMGEAIETLRGKDREITDHEALSVSIAVLLHDIGHSPFSHTLENILVDDLNHEEVSVMFMNHLNKQFNGVLTEAITIFKGTYHKKFLHQLVSGQLDMDRLDYLNRDSFFTGVSEGVVSYDRIIKMLDVHNDQLVVQAKGIYSIEKFIIARRLMYWQVYFHKTVLAAEKMLVKVLQRAKELTRNGTRLFATPAFQRFLENDISRKDFINNPLMLDAFSQLDDYDILTSIKVWATDQDKLLSVLCDGLINRRLYKCLLQNEPVPESLISKLKEKAKHLFNLSEADTGYFVFTGMIANNAYNANEEKINILLHGSMVKDIAEASDHLNISVLSGPVIKYFLCIHPLIASDLSAEFK